MFYIFKDVRSGQPPQSCTEQIAKSATVIPRLIGVFMIVSSGVGIMSIMALREIDKEQD